MPSKINRDLKELLLFGTLQLTSINQPIIVFIYLVQGCQYSSTLVQNKLKTLTS